MPITAAFLQSRFPAALGALSVPNVLEPAIAEAYRANDATMWGGLLDDAVMYYAAMVALVGGGAAAAIAAGISSASAGPVSVSFGGGGGGASPFDQASGFGSMYKELLLRRIPGFLVV